MALLVRACGRVSLARPISLSATRANIEMDDDGLPKDYKLRTLKVGSRRLDTFVARATGKSSSVVEKLILGGKVQVNEETEKKKAYNVCRGDLIDVWNGAYPDNSDLAQVDRMETVDYEVTKQGYDIKVKQWKNFLVENWK